MSKTKKLTNKQFLAELGRQCDNDILLAMVTVQALGNFADRLSEADPAKAGNALIDGRAWVEAGKRLKSLIDANYGEDGRAREASRDA